MRKVVFMRMSVKDAEDYRDALADFLCWREGYHAAGGEINLVNSVGISNLKQLITAHIDRPITDYMDRASEMMKSLERLASTQAFDVATAHIPKELKMRMEYADAAIKKAKETKG